MKDSKHEWISFVKTGQLDKGYALYLAQNPFHAFSRRLPLRVISSFLSLIFAYLVKRAEPELNLADEAVDLSEEFVIFWKCPDVIGRMLLMKILKSYLIERKIPARALGWYCHWLVFQGRYKQSGYLFKYLLSKSVKGSRLHGEILSLSGNYFYSRNKLVESIRFHRKADLILKANSDRFFQMFNLGTSAKSFAEYGELDLFKTSVLGGFDNLNPMEPDERYGMRVLIYYAYLNFIHDNNDLGKQFYVSAERCYLKSGSSLDKAIYCAYKAIILLFFRDLTGSRESIKLARKHISEFGKYRSHEELILNIESHLYKGTKSHLLINNLLGTDNKAKRSELESWYQKFFTSILPIFEDLQCHPIEHVISVIQEVCTATVNFQCRDAVCIEDVKSSRFEIIDHEEKSAQFDFDLFHQNKIYSVSVNTIYKKWRNPEIYESIRASLYLLHSLSKQDHLKRVTYFQEQKLKEAEIAKRIAHDIKSPLAALQLTLSKIDLQHSDLTIVRASTQKIEDIVHDLNQKRGAQGTSEVKKILVKTFMDAIVADKRIEYQERGFEFNLNYLNGSKAKFIEVNELEMYRTLSNIINNAVESYNECGRVEVSVDASHGHIEIMIQDFGCGIDAKNLPLIFSKEVSFKKGGSGLGLYYAKAFLESNHGRIGVTSKMGNGTTFAIVFPICVPPLWIKTNFFLEDINRVVIVDDFEANIEMIKRKIHQHCPEIEVLAFSSLAEVSELLNDNAPVNTFFFIDYNFDNDSFNGLDFIIQKDLSSCSVLATHHFEDEKVCRLSREAGIKILPKTLIEEVHIFNSRPTVFIADDEKYFLKAISGKLEKTFTLVSCATADEIVSKASTLSNEDFFFIDRNFGDSDIRGEDLFELLKGQGKKNLFNISEDIDFYNEHSLKIKKTEIETFLN